MPPVYRFAYRPYSLPLRMVVRTAHGVWTEREGVLVRIEDETGAVGIGEAAPLAWFGTESGKEIIEVCAGFGERVEAERLAAVPTRLGCLRNAIEAAQRGIRRARRANRSEKDSAECRAGSPHPAAPSAPAGSGDPALHSMGQTQPASYLSVAALLPAGRAAMAQLREKAEAGFRVFKWKVGVGDLQDELAWLDELCGELPSGAKLRLDANGAWDRRQTERWLERCAERPIEFVEQPIARDRRGADDLLLGLADDYPTALALDESLVGAEDITKWVGAGWRGVFVVKPSLFGDVEGTLAKLSGAKATVVFSSALETAVGARASLEHAFVWTGERRALGFGVWPLFADARFDGPAAAPFIRREDLDHLNPETLWNALS
jgi:O-succinylbenzoate synthase